MSSSAFETVVSDEALTGTPPVALMPAVMLTALVV
jgi:hypothetical protein